MKASSLLARGRVAGGCAVPLINIFLFGDCGKSLSRKQNKEMNFTTKHIIRIWTHFQRFWFYIVHNIDTLKLEQ